MTSWDPPLLWLAGGLVLLVLEVPVPGAFMMWLGLAALGTGAVESLHPLPFAAEVVVFAVFAAVSIAVGLRLRQRRARALNTPESGLVGRSARVLEFHGRDGRVRVGDSDWPARLVPGVNGVAIDQKLRVTGVDGTVLLVGPDDAPPSG
jgi:membrane protein implicated in regulation of membrane protease activity